MILLKQNIRLLLLSVAGMLLLQLGARGQTRPVAPPAQLMQSIRKSKADTNRISLELQIGNYYIDKDYPYENYLDSTIKYFNQALALSNVLHSDLWKHRAIA